MEAEVFVEMWVLVKDGRDDREFERGKSHGMRRIEGKCRQAKEVQLLVWHNEGLVSFAGFVVRAGQQIPEGEIITRLSDTWYVVHRLAPSKRLPPTGPAMGVVIERQ